MRIILTHDPKAIDASDPGRSLCSAIGDWPAVPRAGDAVQFEHSHLEDFIVGGGPAPEPVCHIGWVAYVTWSIDGTPTVVFR